jgi:hypothetical protein
MFGQVKPFYELLVVGDESKRKNRSLEIIENYWNKQMKNSIKNWHRNTVNMKMKDISKKYLLINLNNDMVKYSNKILI